MDKISGILPSNARVTNVELRDSSPVRAGTVGFGQEQASSASRRHLRTETPFGEADSEGRVKPLTKEEQQAEMVRKMNNNFFNTTPRESTRSQAAAPQAPSSQQPTLGAATPQVTGSAQAASPEKADQPKMEIIPEKPDEELEGGPTGFFKNAPAVDELYPKGSFLNTVA